MDTTNIFKNENFLILIEIKNLYAYFFINI